MSKSSIAVIGAGPMGLICAYQLLKQGHQVTLFERDDRIGGMSASFDLGGVKIERFYHFICATDFPLFELLKEFNIDDKLIWQETKMGFYYQGKLYPWGDPISLLRFPKLNLFAKIRYGLHVMYTKTISDWRKLDRINAIQWLKKWLGEKTYQVLWDSLFRLKFYEYEHDLSAAWIGTRIKRVAKSRKSLFKESMGYLAGGSDTLLAKFEEKINALGGTIVLNANVNEISIQDNTATGLTVNGEYRQFDKIISTIPMPLLGEILTKFPPNLRQQITAIDNVGVACVVLRLSQAISPNFWLNINDDKMQIPGIIEYSNLNPEVGHVVYVPYYMPHTHVNYTQPDEYFVKQVYEYLHRINSNFDEQWVLAAKVARYDYAQTVCTTDFYAKLPAMKSAINNFYLADTAFYYPEDRSISESIAVGIQLAELANGKDQAITNA